MDMMTTTKPGNPNITINTENSGKISLLIHIFRAEYLWRR